MSRRINGDFIRDEHDLPRCYSCAYWDERADLTSEGNASSYAGFGFCHHPIADRGRCELRRPNGEEIPGSMYCPNQPKHFLHFCPSHRWAGDPERESLV